jgi:hypothetical protein
LESLKAKRFVLWFVQNLNKNHGMKIRFSGLFEHTRQMLGDFESSLGMRRDFNLLMDTIADDLPQIAYADVSGAITMPSNVVRSDRRDDLEPDRPTMCIHSCESGGRVEFIGMGDRHDLNEAIETAVDWRMIIQPTYGDPPRPGVYRLKPGCTFKTLPDFKCETVSFTEYGGSGARGAAIVCRVAPMVAQGPLCLQIMISKAPYRFLKYSWNQIRSDDSLRNLASSIPDILKRRGSIRNFALRMEFFLSTAKVQYIGNRSGYY